MILQKKGLKKQFIVCLKGAKLWLELILTKDHVYCWIQAVTHISVTSEIDTDVSTAAKLS